MFIFKNITPIYKSIACPFHTIIKGISRVPFKTIIYIVTNNLLFILGQFLIQNEKVVFVFRRMFQYAFKIQFAGKSGIDYCGDIDTGIA